MRLILLEDIRGLGSKGDIKEVRDGYGRNYLLRQNLARIADNSSIALIRQSERERDARLKNENEWIRSIEVTQLSICVKAGDKGQLFASVGEKEILEELEKLGFKDISGSAKVTSKPIKLLGEHEVSVVCRGGKRVKVFVRITS